MSLGYTKSKIYPNNWFQGAFAVLSIRDSAHATADTLERMATRVGFTVHHEVDCEVNWVLVPNSACWDEYAGLRQTIVRLNTRGAFVIQEHDLRACFDSGGESLVITHYDTNPDAWSADVIPDAYGDFNVRRKSRPFNHQDNWRNG